MFNGHRIKTTENWACAKSQFRDSIIHIRQAPPTSEVLAIYDRTVSKPDMSVLPARDTVPQADMRLALNNMRLAQAKRKREQAQEQQPSYAQKAATAKSGHSYVPAFPENWGTGKSNKPGWAGIK